jgi:DNA polymerase III gamma/tau subunit
VPSLANKYRPKSFDEVVGQDRVVTSLKNVLLEGRGQAFLFVGPSGVGKTTLARILAMEFAEGKGTAANIEEINAADLNGVEDMRSVVLRSQYRALGASSVRAIILDEVHRLSGPAWQVLLKPIEEPPPHVYWLLCTTELGKIPKTILTRVLRYDLQAVDDLELYELLERVNKKERLNVKESILEVCAEEAQGSPRQALTNLEVCQSCTSKSEVAAALRSAASSGGVIDICRWLVSGENRSWDRATRLVAEIEGSDGESSRIVICNYITAVLIKTKSDDRAARLLAVLDCFTTPYNSSDKLAPLLVSIGMAIGLNNG